MSSNKITIHHPHFKTIVFSVSLFIFFVGVCYAISLIVNNIRFEHPITKAQTYIVGILISAGLLGSVFDYVLEKLVDKYFNEYFGQEAIENKLKYQIGGFIEKQHSINESEETTNDEFEFATLDKRDVTNEIIDTVIVPVKHSFDTISEKNEYIRKSLRPIKRKDLVYIAFYINKKIVGYGKIVSIYDEVRDGHQHFKISSFSPLEIQHDLPYAYIQNYKYCTSESLKKAKTTLDIRPNKYSLT